MPIICWFFKGIHPNRWYLRWPVGNGVWRSPLQAPVGYFDPMGLSNDGDVETFRRRREAELKNGRVFWLGREVGKGEVGGARWGRWLAGFGFDDLLFYKICCYIYVWKVSMYIIYLHIYIRICIHIYIQIYIHVYVYIYIYIHTYIYIYIYIYIYYIRIYIYEYHRWKLWRIHHVGNL